MISQMKKDVYSCTFEVSKEKEDKHRVLKIIMSSNIPSLNIEKYV